MKLKFYADPGHGWLAVKRNLLHKYGVADKVSAFSYQRGATVYLEEDCDAGLILNALKAAGVEVSFIEKHTDKRSPIRSYDRYSYVGAVVGHMVDKRLR